MGCSCPCALVSRAGKHHSSPVFIPGGRITPSLDTANKNDDVFLFKGEVKLIQRPKAAEWGKQGRPPAPGPSPSPPTLTPAIPSKPEPTATAPYTGTPLSILTPRCCSPLPSRSLFQLSEVFPPVPFLVLPVPTPPCSPPVSICPLSLLDLAPLSCPPGVTHHLPPEDTCGAWRTCVSSGERASALATGCPTSRHIRPVGRCARVCMCVCVCPFRFLDEKTGSFVQESCPNSGFC